MVKLSLFALVLTLGAYEIGLFCQKKVKSPLCNPLLMASLLVIGFLLITKIPNESYQEGTAIFSWLLTPATVCLALPLYRHIKVLKNHLPAILAGVAAGTVTSLFCLLYLCKVFSFDTALTVSLLPKSVTTAMGMVLSELNGGIASISAAAIIITGLLGSLFGSALCKLFRFRDPVTQGVAIGTSTHVIGTSRAAQMGDLQGAVSSLSLAVAGLLTAVLFPFICMLL